MSRTIRTVGVGFLGAGWLAMHYQADFVFLAGDGRSPAFRDLVALQANSPLVAHIIGVGLYFPAIFVLGCLGVSLFIAGGAYPFLEDAVSTLLESVVGKFYGLKLLKSPLGKAAEQD
ncbi:hypothetical protein HAP93_05565 [Acidithiobacillus ferriphilus]|uniref:hypothetical protein n=1 Tax=Acidithiobacillus ferriphilus TaxID=1689834 RepID=UPI001C062639|nr:hypothetical protein [Acidithiobacillus ferriphilus]MBU2785240.1 hypothetical protein [Acidithiobacillus ferriphilus]